MADSPTHYVFVGSTGELPDIRFLGQHKTAVVADITVDPNRQHEIADWIWRSGSIYMAAWGVECSSWDDAVDMAQIMAFPDYRVPDEVACMTTWHEKVPMEEMFWFLENCAWGFLDQNPDQWVIIHIAGHADRDRIAKAAQRVRSGDYQI